jgi:hypothetical protein
VTDFRRWGRAAAGPLLIAAGVAAVLHGFLLHSRVSSQHPDVLGFWLPTYCFLGKSLAAGHLPAWNPHVMGGVPFAADPQSGWMYAPAMLLFSTLPCGVATRAMIALQPVLGGLGLYGFLRREGLSSPAATTGGLALALGLCASRLVLFLPFPSAFAWTAVLLWCCSGAFHARTSSGRIGWALGASVAWGQLAGAYFSHGLILGTAAVLFYLGAKTVGGVRAGTHPGRGSLALLGLLALAFVGVNLAFLLPRLAYIPETSYGRIVAGPVQVGSPPAPLWPLKLATSPGGYLGMAALVLAGAAPWSRRHRPLVFAFGAYGAASYLLGVDGIAPALARAVKGLPVLDFYAHFPGRFSLGLFLALPVLAAIGLDTWLEPRRALARILMLAPGILIFVLLPAALGAGWHRLLIPAFGLVAGGGAVFIAARRPRLVALVPGVLTVELVAGALFGQTRGSFGGRAYADNLFETRTTGWFVPLAAPDIDVEAYLRPGPIARVLRGSLTRYMSLDPGEATSRGYLTLQDPGHWGLMANGRAMLFGLQDAQGYNPVQLDRYWTYVRAVTRRPLAYNTSIFDQPSSTTRDLLEVGQVIVQDHHGTVPCCLLAREERWLLFGSSGEPARPTVLSSWRVVRGKDASLRAVAADSFDPSRTVILESDPAPWFSGIPDRREGVGEAQRSPRPQTEAFRVLAPAPSVVLVRIPYARNWHATVDGEAARILPADHFLMGIPVRRGSHTVVLNYHDAWIGYGLLGSLVFVLALVVASFLVWRAGAARLRPDRGESVSAARSG